MDDNLSVDMIRSTDNLAVDNQTEVGTPSIDKSINQNGSTISGGASQLGTSNDDQSREITSSRLDLPPQRKWTRSHPYELIIGDVSAGVKTRRATHEECLYSTFYLKWNLKRLKKLF